MCAKLLLSAALALSACGAALAAPRTSPLDQQTMPDRLEMNDGRTLQGLILNLHVFHTIINIIIIIIILINWVTCCCF